LSGEAPVEIFMPVFESAPPHSRIVIRSSAFPVNGIQDLYENLCIGDAAFLGYQTELL